MISMCRTDQTTATTGQQIDGIAREPLARREALPVALGRTVMRSRRRSLEDPPEPGGDDLAHHDDRR